MRVPFRIYRGIAIAIVIEIVAAIIIVRIVGG